MSSILVVLSVTQAPICSSNLFPFLPCHAKTTFFILSCIGRAMLLSLGQWNTARSDLCHLQIWSLGYNSPCTFFSLLLTRCNGFIRRLPDDNRDTEWKESGPLNDYMDQRPLTFPLDLIPVCDMNEKKSSFHIGGYLFSSKPVMITMTNTLRFK